MVDIVPDTGELMVSGMDGEEVLDLLFIVNSCAI